VLSHYNLIVICKAKYILWTECELTLHDVLKLEKICRWDTSSHTQAEADLEDVMDAMEKLDRQNALPKVYCEAENLLQLPPAIPALSVGVKLVREDRKSTERSKLWSHGVEEQHDKCRKSGPAQEDDPTHPLTSPHPKSRAKEGEDLAQRANIVVFGVPESQSIVQTKSTVNDLKKCPSGRGNDANVVLNHLVESSINSSTLSLTNSLDRF